MDWPKVKLGELLERAKSSRAGERNFPILSMTMHSGLVDQSEKFKKRVASSDTSAYKVVKRRQLVVGFPIDEGVLSIQNKYDNAIVSPAYNIWDIAEPNLEPIYLERYLRGPRSLDFYKKKLRGSTARRRSLPLDVFLDYSIPLPPLEEQRRIAAILDKADEVERETARIQEMRDEVIQATFRDMFGDPVTNPNSYTVTSFGDLLKSKPSNGLYKTSESIGSGVLYLTNRSLFRGVKVDLTASRRVEVNEVELEKFSVKNKDIMINRVSVSPEGVGKAALVEGLEESCVYESNMMRVRLDSRRLEHTYLVYYLNTVQLRQNVRNLSRIGNQASINQKGVNSIPIILPPIELQNQFADIVRHINSLDLSALETQATTLKAALSQELLS